MKSGYHLFVIELFCLFLSFSFVNESLAQGQIHSPDLCGEVFLENLTQKNSFEQVGLSELNELTANVSQRVDRVLEFSFIRNLAQKRGIRVWLFGGTASSFLHYVKWDLARIHGLSDLQKERFDYDFTNIFRATQDIDLVVDASPEKTREFQAMIAQRFPHFLGDKSNHWEVRSLNHRMGIPGELGYKEALLNDLDFQNQNSDSHSLGMIEITIPPGDEPIIRDLRNWEDRNGVFLKDALEGKIHFLRSKNHFQTSRAKAGENPEILSVLRVLVKASQFDLKFSGEDLEQMKEIIQKFDPHDLVNLIGKKRVIDTAKKLVFNVVDLEFAFNQLDDLGLRKKLIALGNPIHEGTLAWWLNREPLRSYPIGQGDGLTARQLGISVVSHETKDFLAMESITRAASGEPNVFISRSGVVGEAAMHGEGFYTTQGRQSTRGTGMTIRFWLDPNARQGSDFEISGQSDEMVIVKNKKALKIIPESLKFDLDDILRLAETSQKLEVSGPDRGIWEKQLKRLNAAKFINELDQFLRSDSDVEFKRGLRILEALRHIRVVSLISEEIRKAVIKSSFEILSALPSGSRQFSVLEFVGENKFFKERKDILDLFVIARKNKEMRQKLMELYSDEYSTSIRPIVEIILDAFDVSNEIAFRLVDQVERIYKNQLHGNYSSLEELFEIKRLTYHTSLEEPLSEGLLVAYAYDETGLSREILRHLTSSDLKFRDSVIQLLKHERLSHLKIIQALRQIIAVLEANPSLSNFNDAVVFWMKSENMTPELKAAILLSQFGSHSFKAYSSSIPPAELPIVMKACLEKKGLGSLKRLAIQEDLSDVKEESFVFHSNLFPQGGKRVVLGNADPSLNYLTQGNFHLEQHEVILSRNFEIQLTPVTQLQWALVMGQNPSYFTTNGQKIRIRGRDILMNPNRPVENVSWNDVQEFIKKLNRQDPDYDYRLPTEAEWEYSARGDILNPDLKNPNDYGWYYLNSGLQTHDVATLKPSSSGLYDTYGNVWEWVRDRFSRIAPSDLSLDPRGPTLGTDRVVRGGAYDSGRYFLDLPRYTLRRAKSAGTRNPTIGFRLVRVPKGAEKRGYLQWFKSKDFFRDRFSHK